MAFFSPVLSESRLASFLVSPLSTGKSSSVSCLGTLASFPFAPVFPFVCTFWSAEYPFLQPLWPHVHRTFSGTGLAHNLAHLLGSPFSTPLVELTLPLGIMMVVGWVRARWLLCTNSLPKARRCHSSWPLVLFDDTAWPTSNTVFVMVQVICQLDWVIG